MSAKPKPTRLRILEGNPSGRAIPKDEPQPDLATTLRPPKNLCVIGRREYKRLGQQLRDIGILSVIDLRALALYADVYARWTHAQKAVKEADEEQEPFKRYGTGSQFQAYLRLTKQLQQLLVDFGMTPSARAKISNGSKSATDFDDL